MMLQGFENLSERQYGITKDAITWITVLIAGADGEIDAKETDWASKLTKIRGYANPNKLNDFYDEVGKDFSNKLAHLLENVPSDTKERQELLTRKLGQLNSILPAMGNLGAELYESYTSFAVHVAKASGGFLGFFSVNKAEAKLMTLPMLDKVEFSEEEE